MLDFIKLLKNIQVIGGIHFRDSAECLMHMHSRSTNSFFIGTSHMLIAVSYWVNN